MKKLLVLIIAAALPALLHAQTSKVEKLFKKYSGNDGYTAISISEYMFELFSSISDDAEDAAEFKEATSGLTGIRVLTIDSIMDLQRPKRFYNELTTTLSAPEYKELMLIQDGPDEIKFVIHEEGKKISELVMMGEVPSSMSVPLLLARMTRIQ